MLFSMTLSDAQIFNQTKLRETIKDGTLGLLPSEPLKEGGPDLHLVHFLLGDDDIFIYIYDNIYIFLFLFLLVAHH